MEATVISLRQLAQEVANQWRLYQQGFISKAEYDIARNVIKNLSGDKFNDVVYEANVILGFCK